MDNLHVLVLLLLVVTGFFSVWFRDLLCSVICSGAFSLLMALEFFMLQAPDVAIAEAGIGAALDTAIFIIALSGLGYVHRGNGGGRR
ncbi:MAG: hydrogenase subunit MbhD domain-containing protein [Pyramidobacter sp.]|nr:hydrogenase subunit MbhD domain-containing protein [Pyramidobacter sp.]